MYLRPSMRPLRSAAGGPAPLSLGELVAAMREESSTDREAVAKVVRLIRQGRVAVPDEAGAQKTIKIGV